MSPFDLLVLALATWRLAYLLVKEAAPFGIMTRIRAYTTLGGMLDCLYCSSVWAAIACYIALQTPLAHVVYIAAVSGLAMLLWRFTGGNHLE